MSEKRRLEAAEKFRALLDDKEHHRRSIADGRKPRALALAAVCAEFGIDRATLYRYCKRFGIPTA